MLVNIHASFGSMDAASKLYPTLTLGSGSVGKGIISDNVSLMNLIYVRKVMYGVRKIAEIINTNRLLTKYRLKNQIVKFEVS